MAVIIIDQKTYEVDQQKNLLETALSLGLDLPYFCWHKSLGSVGSCRMCAVQQFVDEKDLNGRTVMACMTEVKENSRFSITHPICAGFRKNVIEWLMINHPHDCPVCDEGGECHLQDMTLMSGHNYRRYRFLKRTFRNQNLGPFINHEMNRCITCYRCVRFYKDLAGGNDLSAFSQSGRVYFGRWKDGTLENEFSGNLVEICPTGVFTDKTYHQRYVRKWDLSTAPSVCQLCGVGCNISPGERGGILRRVQNRFHHEINGYYLCDRGRFGHEFVNVKDRPLHVIVGDRHDLSFRDAVGHVGKLIKNSARVVGIGSPRATLEANWMLKQLVGAENFYDGFRPKESQNLREIMDIFYESAVEIASQKDIREADAILIVGEDVTNTAPRVALSIREAQVFYKQRKAEEELNIPPWNDAAVRDYARHHDLPIYIASSFATGLDFVAKARIKVHPEKLKELLFSLLQSLQNGDENDVSSPEHLSFVGELKTALTASKNPVIITGGSLGEADLIRLSFAIARFLDLKNHGQTKLSFVVPEANSIGLFMLSPKSFAEDFLSSEFNYEIDTAIVLENDLAWRLGTKPFQNFCKRVKNLVVIDSLWNDTAKRASVFLPCANFLESTGTLVSAEGRIQRYYGVKPAPREEINASFRVVSALNDELAQNWSNVDDVCKALAQDLGFSSHVCESLFTKDFNVAGRKIPRQSSEFSGRTALLANVTMHEPKPTLDIDSPFVFSMEGASRKIPLPLISTSWAPNWNSVQSSFKTVLGVRTDDRNIFGGVRLFSKIKAPKEAHDITFSPGEIDCRRVYVLPCHHIFGSSEMVNFSPALSSRKPQVIALMSVADSKKNGFSFGASIVLETSVGKFSLFAETRDDVPEGILLLPFGLVDASLFFETCKIVLCNEERV